jgi:hypothetical protein
VALAELQKLETGESRGNDLDSKQGLELGLRFHRRDNCNRGIESSRLRLIPGSRCQGPIGQTVEARHVHIHSGAQGVVGIINSGKEGSGGRGEHEIPPAMDNSSQSNS